MTSFTGIVVSWNDTIPSKQNYYQESSEVPAIHHFTKEVVAEFTYHSLVIYQDSDNTSHVLKDRHGFRLFGEGI